MSVPHIIQSRINHRSTLFNDLIVYTIWIEAIMRLRCPYPIWSSLSTRNRQTDGWNASVKSFLGKIAILPQFFALRAGKSATCPDYSATWHCLPFGHLASLDYIARILLSTFFLRFKLIANHHWNNRRLREIRCVEDWYVAKTNGGLQWLPRWCWPDCHRPRWSGGRRDRNSWWRLRESRKCTFLQDSRPDPEPSKNIHFFKGGSSD